MYHTSFLIQTVLFDLDGTLADTAPDLAHALNVLREEHDLPALPFETIRPAASHGSIALLEVGFQLAPGDDGFDDLRERYLELYQNNIHLHTRLFPGMEQVLKHIEGHGMKWGVVTNKPSWLTEPLLESMALTQRAACIVSGDTLAERKPHPAPLLYACEQTGSHAAQCLYIGDAERDIVAGHRAGMKTLVALFGYLGAEDKPAEWPADGMVTSAEEIIAWLG